jgi:uncharacterized membrane protein YcaP (DUF421 family)
MLKLGVPALELVIRCAAIYLALLFGLRLFGKREVGQFTLFDLVFVLLVANAVQPAMTGPDSSLVGGLVIIVTLLCLNFAVAWLRSRYRFFNRLIQPHSVVVARDGKWIHEELQRQGVTDEDALAALREHGVDSIGDTNLVVLEADGSLSVVARDQTAQHRRRRVRFIRHQ